MQDKYRGVHERSSEDRRDHRHAACHRRCVGGRFDAAQGVVAAAAGDRNRLWPRLHGPGQHQFCVAANESGPALQRHRVWRGSGALLHRVRAVRSAVEPAAAAIRSQAVAGAGHVYLGIAGGGDDVRAHAAPIQCAAVSAGRGGSRVFSRSALLPDVVVSGPYAGARGQPVLHCAAARVDGDGCASRMAFGPRRQVRPGWLAMAVSSGRIAVRVVQPGDTEVAAGRAAERDVADG
jgi:hypothetical protein